MRWFTSKRPANKRKCIKGVANNMTMCSVATQSNTLLVVTVKGETTRRKNVLLISTSWQFLSTEKNSMIYEFSEYAFLNF